MVRMPSPQAIPSHLRGEAFVVSDTEWHRLGRKRLRGRDLEAPFRGIRSVDIDTSTVRGLCRAYAPLLSPQQAFCSVTAAILHGMPLPLALVNELTVHVGSIDGTQPPRRRGVHGHRLPIDTPVQPAADGFGVTAAPATWCLLATLLTPAELTAIADYLTTGARRIGQTREAARCTVPELEAALASYGQRTGVAKLRTALRATRRGVDSAPETFLRLLLVAEGFAEPRVGVPVIVERGSLTLHPDLAWPELRIAVEYEGDVHRSDARRFRADIRRREMFEAAGWRVIRVTADDLGTHRLAFVARLHTILAARIAELSH